MLPISNIVLPALAALFAVGNAQGGGGGGVDGGVGAGGDGGGGFEQATETFAATTVATASSLAEATSASTTSSSSSSSSDVACNNSPDLCSRAYNNVTFMGAHDSPFLRDDSTDDSTAGNQYYNATIALDAGLRLLQGQVHVENETLYLCHTSCSLLNAGLLSDWLAKINSWMDENPYEVVTLVLVNSDDASVADFASHYQTAGIDQYAYTPSSTSATSVWPSLGDMIDSGTRLVSFIASITYDSTYPYLLDEFTYVFETDYEVLTLDGFNCTVDRPTDLETTGGASAVQSGYLSLMNHFKYKTLLASVIIPDVDNIETTNSDSTTDTGALGTLAEECSSEWGAPPNFVLVDFFDQGEVMSVADTLNDVTSATGRVAASENDSDSESGALSNSQIRGTGIAMLAFISAALSMF